MNTMDLRFLVFITIIVLVLCGGCFYLGNRMLLAVPFFGRHQVLMWVTFALFIALQIAGPIMYRGVNAKTGWPFVLQWVTYGTLGLFASLVVYAIASDLVLLVLKRLPLFSAQTATDLERRAFFAVGLAALGSWGIGVYEALKDPTVIEVDLPIKGLDRIWDGFRIVQISDVHIGPILGASFIKRIVEISNSLSPDLVALTGDLVDGTVEQMGASLEGLRSLQAPSGVFSVTGNHEYYWSAPDWVAFQKRLGIRVLLNEHELVNRGPAKLLIAGVTDSGADRFDLAQKTDLKKALAGFSESEGSRTKKILLAHRPDCYNEANELGFDVQLSGHTHGGQFFPWSVFVAIAHRYYKGLTRIGDLWLYVNRGTGFWGPPVRFGVPSEITLLKLKAV